MREQYYSGAELAVMKKLHKLNFPEIPLTSGERQQLRDAKHWIRTTGYSDVAYLCLCPSVKLTPLHSKIGHSLHPDSTLKCYLLYSSGESNRRIMNSILTDHAELGVLRLNCLLRVVWINKLMHSGLRKSSTAPQMKLI